MSGTLEKLRLKERTLARAAETARLSAISAGYGDCTPTDLRTQLLRADVPDVDRHIISKALRTASAHVAAHSALMAAASENGLEWWEIPGYI